MSSMFSFLRGRDETPDEPSTELVRSEDAPAETTAVALLEAAPEGELNLPPNTASTPEEALATILKALGKFLPPHDDTDPLSAANVSSISVSESSLAIGNRRGTESLGAFPAVALKGGRLNAVVRLELRGDDLDDVESALENLHASLLAARNDLWQVGFLRFAAESSTSAEHVPTLDAWRKTADYRILYEYHYQDSEEAGGLIARIPIDISTDLANEAIVVTDEMARWDHEGAPTLFVRGRLQLSGLSLLAHVPDPAPSGTVTITRTFAGAAGAPTVFTTLADFVAAVTNPVSPERHAQITFDSLVAFLNTLTAIGESIMLGAPDLGPTQVSYQAYVLDFTPPLFLTSMAERLELSYQGTDANQFVLYIQAKRV